MMDLPLEANKSRTNSTQYEARKHEVRKRLLAAK